MPIHIALRPALLVLLATATLAHASVWTPVGPFRAGNPVLAFAPGAPDTLVVSAAGALALSTDGGDSFALVSLNAAPIVAWAATVTGGLANPSAFPSGKRMMAVDAAGNVYVTGTQNNGVNQDFLTIKYDASGAMRWRAVANGETDKDDVAAALVLDVEGNAYVTGQTYNGSDFDFLTVKYGPDGTELWRVLSSTAGNRDDFATGLTTDVRGNVYVTGPSTKGTEWSCLSVKYDRNGVEQWRSGTDCGGFIYPDLAVDVLGNAYVLSTAPSISFLVKYNASGVEQWRVVDTSFAAAALVIDSQGNVHVTGTATFGNGLVREYVTVKYDQGGAVLWRVHNGGSSGNANAIALDSDGSVYVSGIGSGIFSTFKYNANGVVQWHAGDISAVGLAALTVDANRNVYVTGQSRNGSGFDFITTKYSESGVEQWRRSLSGGPSLADPATLAIDGSGSLLVTATQISGFQGSDYLTVKYTPNGDLQWSANEGQTKASATMGAVAASMAVDGDDNVYITGSSQGRSLTFKYSAGGAEQWRAFEPESGAGNLIAADSGGNVFIAKSSSAGYVTIKYNASGARQWRVVDSAGGTGFAAPQAMTTDSAGNVYVTGVSFNGIRFFVTIKYDANGVQQWRAIGNASVAEQASGNAVSVDSGGNVYVTGVRFNGDASEYVTIKYSANGAEQWRAVTGGAGNGFDFGSRLVLDPGGNAYVAGASYNGLNWDYLTIKYDPNGNEVWRKVDAGSAAGAPKLALDAGANVYVLRSNYVLAKYHANGLEAWRTASGVGAVGNDIATALVVDGNGNSFVTGGSHNGRNYDYLTIKYGPDGREVWRVIHNNLSADDFAYAVALGRHGSVFVGGNSNLGYGPPGITIQKIVEQSTSLTVVEFYNPDLGRFFITADPVEQAFVDTGAVGRWERTGNAFKAGGTNAVCRFYGNSARNPANGTPYGPNSHFYTVNSNECETLKDLYAPDAKSWKLESYDFLTTPPANGACAAGLIPVYRAYNDGFARGIDSGHRITSSVSAYQQTVASGWVAEGVVMCAPQ